MLKEITLVDEKRMIFRVTTLNERWYFQTQYNETTGLPVYTYFPSSTWIAGCYPKGERFIKWLLEKGMTEAQAIKELAGDKGTKVHLACTDIDLGIDIDIRTAKYQSKRTGQLEELTSDEIDCINSYVEYIEDYQPIILANEITGFGKFYGGTADKIFAIKDKNIPGLRQIWIKDLKTSKYIFEPQEMQISSYSHMNINYRALGITDIEWANRKLAAIKLGVKGNRKGYEVIEVKDCYDLFENVAYKIWQNQNKNVYPQEKDYPLILSSSFRKQQIIEQEKAKEVPVEEFKSALEKELNTQII